MATEQDPKSHVESLSPNPPGAVVAVPDLAVVSSRVDPLGQGPGVPTIKNLASSAVVGLAGRTCIVIPTLNERNNLEALVRGIDESFAGEPYVVVIVDDGSLDGTVEVARSLQIQGYPIELLERSGR